MPSMNTRWNVLELRQRWRHVIMDSIDHQKVASQIAGESGWSPRYAFMTLMSAGIAVLGLLLSSPAVVIGAMLISPLMNPILGFGFSLAMFDFVEARRSLIVLAVGSALAIAFTALVVLASPLKEVTPEILARTRPNLFDLMVALFAALAGSFAVIKGGGGTIVGVAIATALMPPLGVVGFGLATWNVPVLGGALALFVTNFVTIALAATIMARFYGFGHSLSSHQTRIQTGLLILVFVGLSIPLGVSLSRIAREALTVNQVRAFLVHQFGATSRVTQLAVDFDAKPLAIRSVVIAPRSKSDSDDHLRATLEKQLGRPVRLQVDQILIDRDANNLDAQRAQLQQVQEAAIAARQDADRVTQAVALAAGIPPERVVVDRENKSATAVAATLPGADLDTYRSLERRASATVEGWRVTIVPPFQPLPVIRFSNGSDSLDDAARQAIVASAWAAQRWNSPGLGVPGMRLADGNPEGRLSLAQRRGLAIADLVRGQGVEPRAARASGQSFRLSVVQAPTEP